MPSDAQLLSGVEALNCGGIIIGLARDDKRGRTQSHDRPDSIKQGYYEYVVNPLSSGVPEIPTEALWGCAFEVARVANVKASSKIITPEAMGIQIATAPEPSYRNPDARHQKEILHVTYRDQDCEENRLR